MLALASRGEDNRPSVRRPRTIAVAGNQLAPVRGRSSGDGAPPGPATCGRLQVSKSSASHIGIDVDCLRAHAPDRGVVGGCRRVLVPHTGFEPVISALRGRCPRPLDECGTHRRSWPSLTRGSEPTQTWLVTTAVFRSAPEAMSRRGCVTSVPTGEHERRRGAGMLLVSEYEGGQTPHGQRSGECRCTPVRKGLSCRSARGTVPECSRVPRATTVTVNRE